MGISLGAHSAEPLGDYMHDVMYKFNWLKMVQDILRHNKDGNTEGNASQRRGVQFRLTYNPID